MSKLSEGWLVLDTKDTFKLISTTGKNVKTKDTSDLGIYPVVDQGKKLICGYINEESKLIVIDKPIIIFGDHTRIYKWVDFSFVPGADGTKILEPLPYLNRKFFYYQLNNIELPDKGYSRHFKFLKATEFKVAPLNEQIRIANKLDSLLGKLEVTQKRLDKIPTLLKRYRQSVLAAAVSGELTKEWRDNRESEWTKINFNELIKDSANGLSKRKGDTGEPIVVLRLADFKNGKRKKGVERKIQLNDKERNKYALKCDDILVIRVNGSVDLAGLFIRYESNIEEIYCDHFIRFRLDKNLIDSDFMTYVANSGDGRRYLKSKLSTSAGQNTINQTSIKSLPFLLPKIKEQKQIVKRVEALFKLADQAEQHYQAAKQRSDKLTQSILAKAFRGELVPQDPNDEPASKLLARIQAQRKIEQEGNKKQPKKRVIKSKPKKVKVMTLSNAPEEYLSNLLREMNNEASAKELWNKSEMLIDDFYCQLKAEMETNIIEDKESSDPSMRLLKLVSQG